MIAADISANWSQPVPEQYLPSRAQFPMLRAEMTPRAALRVVALETLRQLQANVPGVLASNDVEFVHQARVALRRLRAAQKTFAAIAPSADWQAIAAEIRWLARLLGQVRDLDVLLTETLPPIEMALAPETDFSVFKKALRQRRSSSRRKIRAALTSTRYEKLVLSLQQWANESAEQPAPTNEKLHGVARQALRKRWRRMARLARHWSALDRQQHHALRKRVKELRYAAEFFSPLYNSKPVARYLLKLQTLQQVLGAMNDGATARQLLDQFIQRAPSLGYTGGIVIGWVAANARQSEANLGEAIEALTQVEAFW